LKLTFLKWRTQKALRKNKSPRVSTPYKKSNSIGIIFSVEDKQKHDDVKEFVKHLELDGKQVRVLEFLPAKAENFEFLFDFFTIQDLNFWGRIDNSKVSTFIQTTFDYLFYLDKEHNPLILNLLAESKAFCRVGNYKEECESYFELMIENKGTVKGMIDNMYKYTKQLR
jgi:pentatricopeptide repeat protein